MEANNRNKNRGHQQLRVWQDAINLYGLTWRVFRTFPYELKRVASQAMAAADSVHCNIAEGCRRRSLRECLYYLNISFDVAYLWSHHSTTPPLHYSLSHG